MVCFWFVVLNNRAIDTLSHEIEIVETPEPSSPNPDRKESATDTVEKKMYEANKNNFKFQD